MDKELVNYRRVFEYLWVLDLPPFFFEKKIRKQTPPPQPENPFLHIRKNMTGRSGCALEKINLSIPSRLCHHTHIHWLERMYSYIP